MMRILPASINDSPSLASLSAQLGYPISPAEIGMAVERALADPGQTVFVARTEADVVAGWVHAFMRPMLMVERHIEVGALVVDENQRGQGIGRMLMAAVEAWAKEQGCTTVFLRSGEQRVDAHRFYDSIGYQRLKVSQTFIKKLE
ncbi:MAG: GNAT family N-acetyltransferase [Anaerolineales bacterium]|nr:GNAT family N-acetyltransferase [Anaerolineales bacterium]